MTVKDTSPVIKAKIILDEANLAFCEIGERKDSAGDRKLEDSVWDDGKMEGEYDEEDYKKILELQLQAANTCDAHPELEGKTAELFQTITDENALEVYQTIKQDPNIMELARISITTFMLRFPTVESFMNKGHPLVMASDEYMMENSTSQNWYDYRNIAQEFNWV